jgi:hypothetical protein
VSSRGEVAVSGSESVDELGDTPIRSGRLERGCLWKPLGAVAVLLVFFTGARIVLDRSARDASVDICERSHVDLVRAAGAGDMGAVRRELATQSVDTRDENDNTALGCAIPRARTEVIAALLTADANPNQPTGRGTFQELPNELALNRGDLATLAALLDRGGDPAGPPRQCHCSPSDAAERRRRTSARPSREPQRPRP